jgi:hypothetical protein
LVAFGIAFSISFSSNARADLVAEWVNFSAGLPVPATGGAQQSTAELDVDTGRGRFNVFGSDELRLEGNGIGWNDASLELSFSGDLFDDFVLTYDVEGFNSVSGNHTPPDGIAWFLSVDGGAFSPVGFNFFSAGPNIGQTLDLTGNAVANGASSLVLRADFIDPDNAAGPSLVFDNIAINAVAIPEPSAFWFLGIAAVLGAGRYLSRCGSLFV